MTVEKYLESLQEEKKEELLVEVNSQDFSAAIKTVVPSVSDTELNHYRQVQAKFSDTQKSNFFFFFFYFSFLFSFFFFFFLKKK